MITYIDNFIGTTYAQNPTEYVLCFLLLIWFIYLFYNLLYWILGGKK